MHSPPPLTGHPSAGAARARALIVALAFAAAWWILDLLVLRAGPPHPLDDLWEDALIARSLLQGNGLTTLMIYPPLWGLRDPATLAMPVLVHGPLLPLLLAPLLAVFGPGVVDSTAWLGALAAWLAALCAGRVATRLVSPAVGAATVLLFTLSPVLLVAVHHSTSVAIGALAVAAALDALVRERPRALAAGLALGAGYLCRPELLLAAPLLALGTGLPLAALAVFAAGFVACALPWWIHHARVVGSPFFNLTSYTLISYSRQHPGYSTLLDFSLTPQRWPAVFAREWPIVIEKFPGNLRRALHYSFHLPSLGTLWLVPVGLWAMIARTRRARLAAAAVLVSLIPLGMMTVTDPQALYAVPMLPLFALAAALGAGAIATTRRWQPPTGVWLVLLAALALAYAVPELRVARNESVLDRELLRDERASLSLVAADRAPALASRRGEAPLPLFSDRPDFVAWTTSRPTIWSTSARFDSLYPPDGRRVARPAGLPAARDTTLTWFHDGHWLRGHRAGAQ